MSHRSTFPRRLPPTHPRGGNFCVDLFSSFVLYFFFFFFLYFFFSNLCERARGMLFRDCLLARANLRRVLSELSDAIFLSFSYAVSFYPDRFTQCIFTLIPRSVFVIPISRSVFSSNVNLRILSYPSQHTLSSYPIRLERNAVFLATSLASSRRHDATASLAAPVLLFPEYISLSCPCPLSYLRQGVCTRLSLSLPYSPTLFITLSLFFSLLFPPFTLLSPPLSNLSSPFSLLSPLSTFLFLSPLSSFLFLSPLSRVMTISPAQRDIGCQSFSGARSQ